MDCPRCEQATRVLESRRAEDGAALRRRRECRGCGHRFTTFERRGAEPLYVLKRAGGRQRFDRTKLRAALLRSTHKRQVSAADVEALVDRVEAAIAAAGGELPAAGVGELCLEGLGKLDRGAYLQFLGTLPLSEGAPANLARSIPQFADSPRPGSVRDGGQHASLPPQKAS